MGFSEIGYVFVEVSEDRRYRCYSFFREWQYTLVFVFFKFKLNFEEKQQKENEKGENFKNWF